MQSSPGLDKTLAYNASGRGKARRARLPDSFLYPCFLRLHPFPPFSNFVSSKAGGRSGHRQGGPAGRTCLSHGPAIGREVRRIWCFGPAIGREVRRIWCFGPAIGREVRRIWCFGPAIGREVQRIWCFSLAKRNDVQALWCSGPAIGSALPVPAWWRIWHGQIQHFVQKIGNKFGLPWKRTTSPSGRKKSKCTENCTWACHALAF